MSGRWVSSSPLFSSSQHFQVVWGDDGFKKDFYGCKAPLEVIKRGKFYPSKRRVTSLDHFAFDATILCAWHPRQLSTLPVCSCRGRRRWVVQLKFPRAFTPWIMIRKFCYLRQTSLTFCSNNARNVNYESGNLILSEHIWILTYLQIRFGSLKSHSNIYTSINILSMDIRWAVNIWIFASE